MRLLLSILVASSGLLATTTSVRAEQAYPRPDLLVEAAELAKPQEAQRYVILDARDEADFASGHVPGARWVDHAQWAKAFGDGQEATQWSRRIGGLGITADTKVVVYDDNQAKDAARIWWILRYWGVADVRLLNGGWVGWQSGNHPVETSESGASEASEVPFEAVPASERLATQDALLESLSGRKLQIVDARTEAEFCGTEALKNSRSGAIPGAKHLQWVDLIDEDTHRFKSPAELKQIFNAAGIQLDRSTATYCQSGGRASVMAFALELMGAEDVQNYYKSWSEWGNSDSTPVVTADQDQQAKP